MWNRDQLTPGRAAVLGLAILAIVVAVTIIINSLSGPRRIEVDPALEGQRWGRPGPTASPAAPESDIN